MSRPTQPSALWEKVHHSREQMAAAAKSAGRPPEEIMLCAVVKGRTSQEIFSSAGPGIDCFGENRAQELMVHGREDAYGDKPVHFIGHLQTNKVRQVVGKVALIQSVNSLRLLSAINMEAHRQGIIQNILLEPNIGDVDSKMGIPLAEFWPLLEQANQAEHICLQGLMAIPPAFDNSDQSRRYFAQTRRLFEQAQTRCKAQVNFTILSMGMSGSFIAAILEGANLVRIGTGIYGQRPEAQRTR